jgi:hypothetical protein
MHLSSLRSSLRKQFGRELPIIEDQEYNALFTTCEQVSKHTINLQLYLSSLMNNFNALSTSMSQVTFEFEEIYLVNDPELTEPLPKLAQAQQFGLMANQVQESNVVCAITTFLILTSCSTKICTSMCCCQRSSTRNRFISFPNWTKREIMLYFNTNKHWES